ncbi:MAG: hypothetical protein ACKPKO_22615 [Candidatus Fonsibacter sp.]
MLKDFSLQIRADKETYYLELQNDLLALIKRKNNIGNIYYDEDNLLKQVALNQQDGLFIDDDEPPQPQEVPAEPQQEQETPPPPPVPEPEAPTEPPQNNNKKGLRSGNGRRGSTTRRFREFQEFVQWKQNMELYDTSLLDL